MGKPMWMVWLVFDGDGVPTSYLNKDEALAAATGPLHWVYRVDTMTEVKRPASEPSGGDAGRVTHNGGET